MPTWLKVVLIVVGVIVLGGAAAGFGVYLWWQQHGRAMLADSRAAIGEGTTFGVGKEPSACVDEAVVRVKGAGVTEAVRVRLFLTSCLKAAKPVAGFCDDVPAKTDQIRTASWQLKLNQRYGLKPPYETSVVPAIQDVCAGEELWLR
jgi:hypothetical protein